jgi:bifunctional non-homologous end joining protein LigD
MALGPMRLLRIPEPSIIPTASPKMDGFRVLAFVRGHRCQLVSRTGHVFTAWPQLAEEIAHSVRAMQAVLDGEICCLQPDGRSHFYKLMVRRDYEAV